MLHKNVMCFHVTHDLMHLLSQLLLHIQNNTKKSSAAALTHQNDAADKHLSLWCMQRIRQLQWRKVVAKSFSMVPGAEQVWVGP